jgi:hypothetical protein
MGTEPEEPVSEPRRRPGHCSASVRLRFLAALNGELSVTSLTTSACATWGCGCGPAGPRRYRDPRSLGAQLVGQPLEPLLDAVAGVQADRGRPVLRGSSLSVEAPTIAPSGALRSACAGGPSRSMRCTQSADPPQLPMARPRQRGSCMLCTASWPQLWVLPRLKCARSQTTPAEPTSEALAKRLLKCRDAGALCAAATRPRCRPTSRALGAGRGAAHRQRTGASARAARGRSRAIHVRGSTLSARIQRPPMFVRSAERRRCTSVGRLLKSRGLCLS